MLFEAGLRSTLLDATCAAAAACAALLVSDVALGLLARAGYATRPADALRRVSPPLVRHAVELVVTGLLTLGAARPVGASSTPVRDWLRRSPSTTNPAPTTSTTTPQPPRLQAPPPTATTTPTTVPASHAAPVPPPATVHAPATVVTPGPGPARAPHTPAADRYVVLPGDCLWRIAARRLGPGATNQAVDDVWRAIYAANRAAIGENPNLIHPGLVLTLPPLAAAH